MTTIAEVSAYVSAPETPYMVSCLNRATDMVDGYTGQTGLPEGAAPAVPEWCRDQSILEVSAELWYRRHARAGIAILDGTDSQPVRIARDPMKAAYDILRPYLKPAIA